MNRATVIALCAAALVVGAGLGAGIRSLNMRQQPIDPTNPVAKPIPAATLGIDFTNQRYDIHCGHPGGATKVYTRCKVLGYTGQAHKGPVDDEEFGRPFENWLAVELEDGRHAYIQPTSVFAIESSPPK